MTPILNLHGFRGYDSLDDLTGLQRFLLTSIVGILISIGFLSLVFGGLNIAAVRWGSLMYVEAFGLGLIYVPVVTALRKSSSLVPIILLLFSMYPLDYFIQAHYRDLGQVALWTYNANGPLGGIPPMLQFLIVWVVDAFLAGCLTLWVSRAIAPMFVKMKSAVPVTDDQYKKFFRPEWVDESVAKPKRDFAFVVMRGVGLIYIVYLAIIILGAFGLSQMPAAVQVLVQSQYANKVLGINTFVKIFLMMSLAMIGAYNIKLRFHTALGLIIGHAVSVVSSLIFYFFYENAGTPYHQFILTSAILDSTLVALFSIIAFTYKSEATEYRIQKEFPEFYSLANRLSVMGFYTLSLFNAGMVIFVLYCRIFMDGQSGMGAAYGFPDPQISNTLVKFSTLCFLSFLLARRELLRNKLYGAITGSYIVGVFVCICMLAIGGLIHPIELMTRNGGQTQLDWYFMLFVALDGTILALFVGLRRMYYNVEYTISALSPAGADNVMAFHGALHGDDPEVDAIVCQAVDAQAADMQGRKRGLLNIPFALVEFLPVILGARSKFSAMSEDNRKYFLRNTLIRQPLEQQSAMMPDEAKILFEIGTATDALVTLAHYSGSRGHEETQFIPPDARDRLQSDIAMSPPPFAAPAQQPDGPQSPFNWKPPTPAGAKLVSPRVVTAIGQKAIPDEVDYLIIGSGAGGAVMAYRLICAEPSAKILVVERGPRLSPLQDFNDNEMEMVRKLYKEGGLQQTKRFDLMVLQGECMGGTTVINNAACLPMPQSVHDTWQNEYDIDLSTLQSHYDTIAAEIGIDPIDTNGVNKKVADVFIKGVTPLTGVNANLGDIEYLSTNHINMLGDGSDNIGNKRMRKRSMLETYIPWAEARGVQFVSETSGVRFMSNGRRVDRIMLRSDLGHLFNVKIRKAGIIAGGVISSSQFLMRSGLMKNVGERLACNLAYPAAYKFDQELKAYDGVQITLGAIDKANRAIFETYFNPPGAFALSLPFFFDEQIDIMHNYPNMINFGALVGSEPNGTIDPAADILDGRSFSWAIGKTDIANTKYAFQTLARIGQFSGATQIILPTNPGISLDLTKSDEVDRFCKALEAYPLRQSDLHLATAHPQGGNGMAGDNSSHLSERVVDGDFRVSGYDNLYVADASLFPTGITVNPQWTIMAMSSIASASVIAQSSSSISSARVSSSSAAPSSLHSDFSMPRMFPWLLGMKRRNVGR